ncbi:hypothetical protein ACFRMN_16050 [Streptomyces sp. NPDC056835]|uniref:hypothetical protein n=1 Tax=Streptomyces sp. NPDC056835 TaxID=3345956 RepID=UPI003693059D
MPTRATDSPASLYGVVSLVLGSVALISVVFSGVVGIAIPLLCGSLAVALAALGLNAGIHRVKCAIGLATGGLSALYLIYLLITFMS